MLEVLKRNNKIIVNTDIDGILSAYVLCRHCGCEIVGFSNSAECVWWRKDRISSIYDAVYIDMYLPRKDVVTIDQHIVAYDERDVEKIKSYGTKFNPNLDNPRTFVPNSSYYLKYPFGTIHYILSVLGRANIDVPFDYMAEVANVQGRSLKVIDFILRADDAMTTSLCSNYTKNAREWWRWLKEYAHMSKNIVSLTNYLNTCSKDAQSVNRTKMLIGTYFKQVFLCDSPDGGFKSILTSEFFLRKNVINYLDFFFKLLGGEDFAKGFKRFYDTKFSVTRGTPIRIAMNSKIAEEFCQTGTINAQEVFSYGYVRSSNRPSNFSYTVM